MAYSSLEPLDEDLGVSRPKLISNFAALETYCGYDHGSLDANDGDSFLHKKISFIQQAADPATQTGKIRMYTKDDGAGTDELFLLRADDTTVIQMTINSGNPVLAATGQTFLPGGAILKWGKNAIASTTTTVTFASAFPNNCFGVWLMQVDTNIKSMTVETILAASFDAKAENALGDVRWLAIGN